ncbi:uncharacterized protein si:ch211-227n13.3 [Dunckerocampus dactyliophorus]|uniref:uncharacterized protein si:ch211-227n13.3 n=1 Tax=Dunckerocampus dactyliophorus TaxID=161453 RepID=UPI0024060DDE|nr:uncharacterized protein si:ch211-227n13.3 [Dunckerocampus dactyliophorus]XP_054624368.1 uncharacterized protein si:ch211-227n13.3 [Dunckerocampus dactyliophorus]
MKLRNSSKLKKPSKKKLDKSPSPNEDVIQRRLRSKRRRRMYSSDIDVSTDSVVDVMKSKHGEEEPEEGCSLQVVDGGLDSDEQCSSSDVFAPSRLNASAPKKPTTPTGLCAACLKLYQRAKKLKTPIIDKLLDNDPTSLTCDQWVLLKEWRPSRTPLSRRTLPLSLLKIQRHMKGKKKAKRKKQDDTKGVCSRPHIFLQRNLRRPQRAPVTKERKVKQRKRPRDDSQGSGIAKQTGFHSNRPPEDSSGNFSNDSSLDSFHSGEHEREDSSSVTEKTIPFSAGMETSTLSTTPPKQKTPKKTKGFRDLLAQLRGNSSMVVKETH